MSFLQRLLADLSWMQNISIESRFTTFWTGAGIKIYEDDLGACSPLNYSHQSLNEREIYFHFSLFLSRLIRRRASIKCSKGLKKVEREINHRNVICIHLLDEQTEHRILWLVMHLRFGKLNHNFQSHKCKWIKLDCSSTVQWKFSPEFPESKRWRRRCLDTRSKYLCTFSASAIFRGRSDSHVKHHNDFLYKEYFSCQQV